MQYGKRVYQYIFYMLMGCQGAWSPCKCNVLFRVARPDLMTTCTRNQLSHPEKNLTAFVLSTHRRGLSEFPKYF